MNNGDGEVEWVLEGIIEERERRKAQLTAGVGEEEGSVGSIEPVTGGICVRVCAPSGGHAFNSSMLWDDSF